jgi:type I restriction enzyme, S subunit
MEVSAGYKQTDIGSIPDEWDCLPSSELAAYFGGNAFKSEAAVSDGIKWLKIANVGKQQVQWDASSFLPATYASDFKDYMLREGDVVMALTRPILDNELKIAKLSGVDVPALLNQRVAKVIASSRADLGFVYHSLQSRRFVESMKDAMAGSDPPNIGSRTLGSILVAAPRSIQEQRAIATALSDVDALIAGLERLIAKKRDIKQATMQQLLTGQTRLPGFSGEWEVKTVAELASVTKGSQLHSSETYDEGQFPYLNGGISASSYTDKTNTPADTIAISEGGNSCGFVQFMSRPFWCGGHCYAVVPKEIDNHFLYHALKGQQTPIMGLRVGSGLPNVQKSALAAFKLHLPSTLPEQTAIATVLSDMDADLSALEARLAKTRAIKQGMMQELLTGRTRLKC